MDPKKIIEAILHFIKSSFFVQFVIFITGMIILFGNQNVLKYFGLDSSFVVGWLKSIIGLITIIAGISMITFILYKVGNHIVLNIQVYRLKRKTVEKIKNLSEAEKLLLFQSTITNMPVVGAPIDNPIAQTLLNQGFLKISIATAMNNMFEIPDFLWAIIRKEKNVIFSEFINLSEKELLQKFKQILKID